MLLAAATLLTGGIVKADSGHIDIDLKDFDDDVMRDMDDANKDLEPAIGAKNVSAALADTDAILNGLKEAEDYFTKKGGTETAVKLAKDGQASVAAVVVALKKSDFDAADAAARAATKNCRSCHDIYKPLTK